MKRILKRKLLVTLASMLWFYLFCTGCTCKTPRPFPLFVDPLPYGESSFDNRILWSRNGDHYPMYFGCYRDTVVLDHFILPINSPPTRESTLTPKLRKQQYEHYYANFLPLNWPIHFGEFSPLDIRVDTSQYISNRGRMTHPVWIRNCTKDTTYLGFGSTIPMESEIWSMKKQWIPVEEISRSLCGTGIQNFFIPPYEYVLTSVLIYPENRGRQQRLRLGKKVFNIFTCMLPAPVKSIK